MPSVHQIQSDEEPDKLRANKTDISEGLEVMNRKMIAIHECWKKSKEALIAMVDIQNLLEREEEIRLRENEKALYLRDGNTLDGYLHRCFHGRRSPLPITDRLKKDL